MSVIQAGALARVGYFQGLFQPACTFVGIQVRGAGQHDQFAVPVIQAAQNQAVCIRVRHDLIDLGYHELIPLPGQSAVFKLQMLLGRHG